MPKPCYFEIPVENMSQAQRFYQDLFHWQFKKLPDAPIETDYYMIETGTSDELGMPYGGMMKKQSPGHHTTLYMTVDAIETYTEKVEQLKGQVIVPKTAVPGKGYFAVCLDLEGNPFGLWLCDESAK